MLEKEYKTILDKVTYEKLLSEDWDDKFIQINFYYANENLKDSKNITVRVRSKNSRFYLQIKVKTGEQDNILISNEYEQEINNIPNRLKEQELKDLWADYNFGDLSLLGFLVTERAIRKVDDMEIALDRNSYNGIVDYEIEIEYQTDKSKVYQLLEEFKILGSSKKAEGKYTRFVNSL